MKRKRWTSKLDGIRSAKAVHFCVACRHTQAENWKEDPCPSCGKSGSRYYFMSEVEQKRAAELLLMQNLGQIRGLKFQPRYDLVVEGVHICTYVADFSYIKPDQKTVIEDVKPEKFIDAMAKMKIDLFNAINKKHGLSVKLHKKS